MGLASLSGRQLLFRLNLAELQDALWLWLDQIQVLLRVEAGLAHVGVVDLTVPSLEVVEVDHPWDMGVRIVCGEHVVRLKALIMGIDALDVWPWELQVKIDKAFESLVDMVDREENFWRLLCRDVA